MDTNDRQKNHFATGATRSVAYRAAALRRLRDSIHGHLPQLYQALWTDLHKSEPEAYLTEISIVLQEIDTQLRHLRSWSRPQRIPTPLFLWPSRSRILCEPYGTVLIIAPWNYPFQLILAPLVGALAAGNCAVLKPSPYTPNVCATIRQIIESAFLPEYVALVEGHRDVNEALLAQRWDYIFFTGSPDMGRSVMQAAAAHLTPITLELGGKSPCIVDSSANADLAARRIVWGKFLNAGQTCVAPDHLFVHQNLKAPLLERIKHWINAFYGPEPIQSPHYGRIVSDRAFQRLAAYLDHGTILTGGQSDPGQRYIAPTIIDLGTPEQATQAPVMQDEIFGPILPVIEYVHLDDIISHINSREKPLALYYFGSPKTGREVLSRTSSGGACINDVVLHLGNHRLPFGGVGGSGMGKYHGRDSFLTFSNRRSVLLSPRNFDLPLKYPPYKQINLIKKLMK